MNVDVEKNVLKICNKFNVPKNTVIAMQRVNIELGFNEEDGLMLINRYFNNK